MTADPILTLAWLILAHLVADFVLQTNGVAAAKTARDGRAWRGFLGHAIGVAICLVPVGLAFGGSGFAALAVIVISHLVIDQAKIIATRRTETAALAESRRRHEGAAPAAGLGRAWTPLPAAWFILDQLAHLAVIGFVWVVWLAGTAPTAGWASAIGSIAGGRDQNVVHEVLLVGVVVLGLLIANVRGGAIFVATLVRPLEIGEELGAGGTAAESAASGAGAPDPAARASGAAPRRGWSIRLGPISGRVLADPDPVAPAAFTEDGEILGERVALPPPARVGATIGVLERLLIVTFVLVGAEAAIGFVIAAKTIARFRLLDDRDFAEYYLLGTLASVSVAIVTGLVARAALSA
jgi:Protein of unknown function (DUF3307)